MDTTYATAFLRVFSYEKHTNGKITSRIYFVRSKQEAGFHTRENWQKKKQINSIDNLIHHKEVTFEINNTVLYENLIIRKICIFANMNLKPLFLKLFICRIRG